MSVGDKAGLRVDRNQLGRLVDQLCELAGQAQRVMLGRHIGGGKA